MKKSNSIKLELLKQEAVRLDASQIYEIEEYTIFSAYGKINKYYYPYSCEDEIEEGLLPPNSITVRNNIIVFSLNGMSKYFIPYTNERYEFLFDEIGLKYTDSSVFASPLTFNQYPSDRKLKAKWFKLLKEAWNAKQKNIASTCTKVAKADGVRKLDKGFLKTCVEIPFGGLKADEKRFYPWLYVYSISPRISTSESRITDEDIEFFVGSYDYDEKYIIFTTNTGKTYIAKGVASVKKVLDEAGYSRIFMPIPLNRTAEWENERIAFSNLDWLLDDYM